MFTDIVLALSEATLPDEKLLRKLVGVALIKKSGVLRQPYHFWTSDPKINPSSKHLLWAAILLEESSIFQQAYDLAAYEILERDTVKGTDVKRRPHLQDHLHGIIDEFLNLAPTDSFRAILKRKVSRVCPSANFT